MFHTKPTLFFTYLSADSLLGWIYVFPSIRRPENKTLSGPAMASFLGGYSGGCYQRTFFGGSQPPGPGNFSGWKPGFRLDTCQYHPVCGNWPGLSDSDMLDTTAADAAIIIWGWQMVALLGLSSSPQYCRHCAAAFFPTDRLPAFSLCGPVDIHSYSGDYCLPASWFAWLRSSTADVPKTCRKCGPFFYSAVVDAISFSHPVFFFFLILLLPYNLCL